MDVSRYIDTRYFNVGNFIQAVLSMRGLKPTDSVTLRISRVVEEKVHNIKLRDDIMMPVVFCEGLHKGFCLSPAACRSLAYSLGTNETNEWVGRWVEVFVEKRKGEQPAIRFSAAEGPATEDIGPTLGPSGDEALRKKLAGWSHADGSRITTRDFINWLDEVDPSLCERLEQLTVDSWPKSVLPKMADWLQDTGAVNKPPTKADAPQPRPGVAPKEIADEDIPF